MGLVTLVEAAEGRDLYQYDRKEFSLIELVAEMFGVSPDQLHLLHTHSSEKYREFKSGEEHLTEFHRTYYSHVNPRTKDDKPLPPTTLGRKFLDVYERFVRELVGVAFTEKTYFQSREGTG